MTDPTSGQTRFTVISSACAFIACCGSGVGSFSRNPGFDARASIYVDRVFPALVSNDLVFVFAIWFDSAGIRPGSLSDA